MKLLVTTLALMSFPLWAEPMDLSILSWNVYQLPKPLKFSMQRDRATLITQKLARVDHDVIVLQEAFARNFRKKVKAGLRERYPHQIELGRSGNWKQVMPSGVMVFSRYPMRRIGHAFYDWCTKADCYSSKGVVMVEVELPRGKKIHIAGTHLNSGREEVSKNVRETQVTQIATLSASLMKRDAARIPLVLAGDLNVDAATDEFSKTLNILQMDFKHLENPEVPSSNYDIPCYKEMKNPKPRWVDHVLLDKRLSKSEIRSMRVRPFFANLKGTECALSDHQAVEAKIRIYE